MVSVLLGTMMLRLDRLQCGRQLHPRRLALKARPTRAPAPRTPACRPACRLGTSSSVSVTHHLGERRPPRTHTLARMRARRGRHPLLPLCAPRGTPLPPRCPRRRPVARVLGSDPRQQQGALRHRHRDHGHRVDTIRPLAPVHMRDLPRCTRGAEHMGIVGIESNHAPRWIPRRIIEGNQVLCDACGGQPAPCGPRRLRGGRPTLLPAPPRGGARRRGRGAPHVRQLHLHQVVCGVRPLGQGHGWPRRSRQIGLTSPSKTGARRRRDVYTSSADTREACSRTREEAHTRTQQADVYSARAAQATSSV